MVVLSPAQEFVSSAAAASTANLITHPLETIKTRQVLFTGIRAPTMLDVSLEMVRSEGPLSLYKGIHAALIRGVLCGGGRLAGYYVLKQIGVSRGLLRADVDEIEIAGRNLALHPRGTVPTQDKQRLSEAEPTLMECSSEWCWQQQQQRQQQTPSSAAQMAIRAAMAVLAGCGAQLLAAPIDLVRTHQAMSQGRSLTIWMTSVNVIREHGVIGMWAGSYASLLRASVFNISQLLTYDEMRVTAERWLEAPGSSPWVHAWASASAGVVATTVSCPAENVKTVMQQNPALALTTACRRIHATGGIRAFFRGWLSLYAKVGPHTLATFLMMEQLRLWMGSTGTA